MVVLPLHGRFQHFVGSQQFGCPEGQFFLILRFLQQVSQRIVWNTEWG